MAHSLKYYASVYAALVSLLIFSAAGIVFLEVNNLLKKRVEESTTLAMISKVETIGQFINFYQGIADRLTKSPEAQDIMLFADHQAAEKWSLSMRRRLPDVVGVALFTEKGAILGKASSQLIGPRCLAEMRLRVQGKPVASPVIHREIPRYAHFDLTALIKQDDDNIGLVFITISLEALQTKLAGVAMASSEIIELHNRKGEMLLTTQKQQNFPNPIIKKMNIPKTDWVLVYKTEAPPLQEIYLAFAIITFVTAIIIAVFAVFLTSLVAKRFAHDFVRISNNLARAVQGKKPQSNESLHLKETDDMMPVINNIAAQIRKKQQGLLELSLTDDLTGLPNRRSLQAVIKQIANFPARGIQACVCIIDIDYFKKINDQFGHLIGDAILLALSNSLKKAQRASDFIARLGGDEFIVVLIDMDKNRIEEWLNRIRSEFRNDTSKDADVVPAGMRSLSCGYVCLESEGDLTLSSILKMADEALYEAKARGRDTIVQYQAPTN